MKYPGVVTEEKGKGHGSSKEGENKKRPFELLTIKYERRKSSRRQLAAFFVNIMWDVWTESPMDQ
jgi:hypothetical protein